MSKISTRKTPTAARVMGHITMSFDNAPKVMMPDFAKYTRIATPAASLKPLKMMWRIGFLEGETSPPGGRLSGGTMTHSSPSQIQFENRHCKLRVQIEATVFHSPGVGNENWKIAVREKRGR
jgi:hypothetical protein